MRVFVLLGSAVGILGVMPQQVSAQVDETMFQKSTSMEVNFEAFEKLTDEGYRDIRVVRNQPPTVRASDRNGSEVVITLDGIDGHALAVTYPVTAAK